ncbi:hypothetical protein [Actinoplanes sp. NPDC051859]|uniref:hypothetical protein n=1 Tax=Actinoplanes sp. NPDC051859 TaxID=3363909 RepID=UPI0037AE06F2
MRKTAVLISAALGTLGTAALFTTAGPVAAATTGNSVAATERVQVRGVCGDVKNPVVGGGKAAWSIHCTPDGRMRIIGWVRDDTADGKCAGVWAYASNGENMALRKACPQGTVTNFDWRTNGPATYINAYLAVN